LYFCLWLKIRGNQLIRGQLSSLLKELIYLCYKYVSKNTSSKYHQSQEYKYTQVLKIHNINQNILENKYTQVLKIHKAGIWKQGDTLICYVVEYNIRTTAHIINMDIFIINEINWWWFIKLTLITWLGCNCLSNKDRAL
jgi:hypothetical protein